MSVPGKLYGRILTEQLMEIIEGKVSKEQGGFREGRGCVRSDICNDEVSKGVPGNR